jgi:hypothetical protein
MAGYLDDLAQGLRLGGGVLNPQVQQFNQQDDMAATNAIRQRQQFMLQQAIAGAREGSVDPAQAAQLAQQMGIQLPAGLIGPSPEAQARADALRRRQAFEQNFDPNAPEEDQIKLAMQYGTPEQVTQFMGQRESRKSREQIAEAEQIRRQDAQTAQLDQRRRDAEMLHEVRMSNARTAEQRAAEAARHNAVMESLNKGQLALQGETLNLRREIAGNGRAPQGYMWADESRTQLIPIPGGPAVNRGEAKPPIGYEWTDETRTQLRAIPGGPATVMTPEQSGKKAMVEQAILDVDRADKLIFDKDGNLRTEVIAGALAPMGGVGEESRLFNSYVRNAVSAKYRLETGAAGNQGEINDIQSRFKPNLLDNAKTAKDKMMRLREFMNMSLADMKVKGLVKDDKKDADTSKTPKIRKYNPTTGKLE